MYDSYFLVFFAKRINIRPRAGACTLFRFLEIHYTIQINGWVDCSAMELKQSSSGTVLCLMPCNDAENCVMSEVIRCDDEVDKRVTKSIIIRHPPSHCYAIVCRLFVIFYCYVYIILNQYWEAIQNTNTSGSFSLLPVLPPCHSTRRATNWTSHCTWRYATTWIKKTPSSFIMQYFWK